MKDKLLQWFSKDLKKRVRFISWCREIFAPFFISFIENKHARTPFPFISLAIFFFFFLIQVNQIKFEFFIFSEWEFNLIFIIIHNSIQLAPLRYCAYNNKTKYEIRNAIRSGMYLNVWIYKANKRMALKHVCIGVKTSWKCLIPRLRFFIAVADANEL